MGNIGVDGDRGMGGGGADGRSVVDGDGDGGAGGRRLPARLVTDLLVAAVPGANGCHIPPDADPHLCGDEEDNEGGVSSRILFGAANRPAAETRKPGRPKKVKGNGRGRKRMQFDRNNKGGKEGAPRSRMNNNDADDPDTPALVDCWNESSSNRFELAAEHWLRSPMASPAPSRWTSENQTKHKRVFHVCKGNPFGHRQRRTGNRAIVKTGDAHPWAIVASPVPANCTNTIITPPSNPSTTTPTVVLYETVTDQARRVAIAVYYLKAMYAPLASDDPQTVSWIVKEWNIPKGLRNMVLWVLCDAWACA